MRLFLCALLAVAVATSVATAQQPIDAKRAQESAQAIARARSLVASGDTSPALDILRKAAEKDRRNGPLLFEWGNLLVEKSRPGWRRFNMPRGIPNIIIKAESLLALAMVYEPDSGHYAIPYGQMLWSTNIFSLYKATGLQMGALDRMDSSATPQRYAHAADQLGIMMFRRYERVIGRTLPGGNQVGERVNAEGLARFVKENFVAPARMAGLPMYQEAVEYFRKARSLDPDNELYFRHEMMALSDLKRWDEIAAASRARIRERPQQPWPWLILGVAEQRRGNFTAAKAALDSGFARLPSNERFRLQSLATLLPRKSQKWYDSLTRFEKNQTDELFWNSANPSFLLPTNLMETEFLARTVYSELRFTDDEANRKGADSDMGEIFVRYGPPDRIFSASPDVQTWVYFRETMMFDFNKIAVYGTARLTQNSWVTFDSIVIDRPSAFTNLPILRYRIDSVSTQVARFRAGSDSMDVAIFAGFRPGALRRNTQIETSTIKHGVFMLDSLGKPVTQSIGTIVTDEVDTTVVTSRSWVVRTVPSVQAVRVEAIEPDLLQLARTRTSIEGFETSGFGLSDLLVVSSATVETGVPQSGQRWSDYKLTPLTASRVARGEPITLLWETYEPASDTGGSGRLQIAISVERETGSGLVAIAGRIVGGLRNAVTGARGNNVTMTYTREFESHPIVLDRIDVQLGELSPGRYRVTLRVTDLVRRSTATRSQRFSIESQNTRN